MRTQTLLLTAALGLAGAVTTMAQVYSVNAVGYVNVDLNPGFQMIANPLFNQDAGGNTVAKLIPTIAEGTTIYKFSNGNFQDANGFEFGVWSTPDQELLPGEGAFVFLPAGTPKTTITFVGEVKQGHLVTALPKGYSIVSSQVPQAGKVTTDLGFPAQEGDSIYTFNNAANSYTPFGFEFGVWAPDEPVIAVGEAFWSLRNADPVDWVRDFSVNQ